MSSALLTYLERNSGTVDINCSVGIVQGTIVTRLRTVNARLALCEGHLLHAHTQ